MAGSSSGSSQGSSQGTSQGSSVSQSTSAPVILQTPQSVYDLMYSQQANQIGANQYGWAQQQYGNMQGIANEAIPQYLQGGAYASQLGRQMMQQYETQGAPALTQFNQLAGTYASDARIAANMGQAEAGATQANQQEWNNTKQQLQSSGIDPSSGMYAELKAAANTAGGASAAGAGQQARQATEATGRGLQAQNIGFQQTLPAGSLNAVNTMYGGQAGAVNTGATVSNTAANAFNSANNWYQTAMGVKLPNQGQQSQSSAASQQSSQQTSQNSSVNSSVQTDPQQQQQQPQQGYGQRQPSGGGGGGSYGGGGGGSGGGGSGGGGGGIYGGVYPGTYIPGSPAAGPGANTPSYTPYNMGGGGFGGGDTTSTTPNPIPDFGGGGFGGGSPNQQPMYSPGGGSTPVAGGGGGYYGARGGVVPGDLARRRVGGYDAGGAVGYHKATAPKMQKLGIPGFKDMSHPKGAGAHAAKAGHLPRQHTPHQPSQGHQPTQHQPKPAKQPKPPKQQQQKPPKEQKPPQDPNKDQEDQERKDLDEAPETGTPGETPGGIPTAPDPNAGAADDTSNDASQSAGAPMDSSMPDVSDDGDDGSDGYARGGAVRPRFAVGGSVPYPQAVGQGGLTHPYPQVVSGQGTVHTNPYPQAVGGGSAAQVQPPPAEPPPALPPTPGGGYTPQLPPQAQLPAPAQSGNYARGGSIGGIPDHYHLHGLPDAASGGHVPYGLSPSHGHTTDDVVANLNAGEFVIPRDVTHYYGHKFFYDLINKGRKEGVKNSETTRGQPMADKGSSGKSNEPPKQNFNMGGGI